MDLRGMAALVSLHGRALLFPIVRFWELIIGKPSASFFAPGFQPLALPGLIAEAGNGE